MISISNLFEMTDDEVRRKIKKYVIKDYLKNVGSAAVGGGILGGGLGAVRGRDPILSAGSTAIGSAALTAVWNANNLRKNLKAIKTVKIQRV